jgi:AraC-like DNA-binding protein
MIALIQNNSTSVGHVQSDVARRDAQRNQEAQRNQLLVERLRRSPVFREYRKAFETSIGLPLELLAPGAFGLVHRGSRRENPFCALMAGSNRSCSGCLELQRHVREHAVLQAGTLTCFAGLSESGVPVRVGDKVIGFLHVGQVLLHKPTQVEFDRTAQLLQEWDAKVDLVRAREAYFRTRVVERKHYDALLRMITIFAQQLSMVSNQLVMTSEQPDSPVILKAKNYIAEHVDEELTLGQVARAVNTSTFYFCKLFRKATGLHFLDYVARARVEKVKTSLLNSHIRISEAAYAAGFQSLSQFNRVFKRVVGKQPRAWREKLSH